MKKIAAFFDQPGAMEYPFNRDEYVTSYQELNQEIKNVGAALYIVRSQDTYLGNGQFSKSWQFTDKGEVVESGPITADCVYNKGSFITDNKVALSNSAELHDICIDKWKTYHFLKEYCPATFLLESEADYQVKIALITTQKIVIKPQDQEEGTGVFIGDKEYIDSLDKEYPLLMQEFIDSSGGISGIVEGIHDLRIALMDGEVVYAFVRTPPAGLLTANVALGGTLKYIEFADIPQDALEFAKSVDTKFEKYGDRFYGIDMAYTPTGFKVIELNSALGLQQNSRHQIVVAFKKKLAQYLLKRAR